ncbi:MAG: hypothetical protein LKJ17_07040 [Oscillospiraceae bacterium]|jgi:hypothetical protein|nr:hypothetical protein [Oscillospiraceae bacterium]
MEKKDRIRKMAIVAEADCWDGVGNKEGKTILELLLIVTAGEDRGDVINRQYVFEGDPPDYICRDLLRMGYLVHTVEDLKKAADELVGMVVRVSLVRDGDTFRVFIDDYFGRDDPEKYKTGIR